MNKKILSALLAVLILCSPFIPSMSAAAETSTPEITRLAGTTRYDTACVIADEYASLQDNSNPNIPILSTVIIANGQNYADALAGVPLAYFLNAPILLTKGGDTLEPENLAKIEEYGTRTAFILGGPSAVSEEISDQLKDRGMTVTRLSGQSRYDTAVEIAQFNFDFLDVTKTAFLVSGENFPDALSAGAAAGITRANILFCPQSGEIKESVSAFIERNGVNNVIIVGGPSAISERAETELAALGVATKRIHGGSRYATSLAVYKEYFDKFDSSVLTFATGANFPDALAGGAMSVNLKAPVILVNNEKDNSAITEAINGVDIEKVIVYGGESVLTTATVRKIFEGRTAATSSVAPTTTTTEATSTTVSTSPTTTTTTISETTTSTTATQVTITETTTQATTSSSAVTTTTTAKPTTTTTVYSTTTTTTTPTTTTTTAPAGRWVSQSEMNRILANVRAHAESIGMHWDTSLNANNSTWGTDTRVITTAYATANEYESRVKGKISYYYNKNVGYEYVNVIITERENGEYAMTCYFG